jgi:hypothetical protein
VLAIGQTLKHDYRIVATATLTSVIAVVFTSPICLTVPVLLVWLIMISFMMGLKAPKVVSSSPPPTASSSLFVNSRIVLIPSEISCALTDPDKLALSLTQSKLAYC